MKRSFVLWLSLLVLVASASAWAGQAFVPEPIVPPLILTGPDIGFRVEAWQGDKAVGRLMVRVDGRWVELTFQAGIVRLSN